MSDGSNIAPLSKKSNHLKHIVIPVKKLKYSDSGGDHVQSISNIANCNKSRRSPEITQICRYDNNDIWSLKICKRCVRVTALKLSSSNSKSLLMTWQRWLARSKKCIFCSGRKNGTSSKHAMLLSVSGWRFRISADSAF